MSAATMNEMERLRRERDALAEKLAVATKRLEDGHLAPVGWISGDRYEAVSREKMDYRRRWKEVCEERDALAAHVERARPMVEAYRSQLGGALWSLDDEEAEYAKDAEDWLSSNPTTSLARLKGTARAEAMERVARRYGHNEEYPQYCMHCILKTEAAELRRQAEEPHHE